MEEIKYNILDLLFEDYYAPWELEVQLAARSVLIPAIEELAGKGLVEWYFRNRDLGTSETLPWSQLAVPAPQLSEPYAWEGSPPESPQILLGLTAKGESAIRHEYEVRQGSPRLSGLGSFLVCVAYRSKTGSSRSGGVRFRYVAVRDDGSWRDVRFGVG